MTCRDAWQPAAIFSGFDPVDVSRLRGTHIGQHKVAHIFAVGNMISDMQAGAVVGTWVDTCCSAWGVRPGLLDDGWDNSRVWLVTMFSTFHRPLSLCVAGHTITAISSRH